jgi:hypothetical protein
VRKGRGEGGSEGKVKSRQGGKDGNAPKEKRGGRGVRQERCLDCCPEGICCLF